MGLTVADSYFLKAKGASNAHNCDWTEIVESVNYALSYDTEHLPSLCFLGEIYAKHFYDYNRAFNYFDQVISINPSYTTVYYSYAKYLIWANEIEKALKLINYAFTLKGIDKGELYWLSAYALETSKKYALSLNMLKQAKIENYNDSFGYFLEDEMKRVKQKIKLYHKTK